jgi:hypothetical protein
VRLVPGAGYRISDFPIWHVAVGKGVLVLVLVGDVVDEVVTEPGDVEKIWLVSPPVHYPRYASVPWRRRCESGTRRTWYVCGAPVPLVRSKHCVPPVMARCWSSV